MGALEASRDIETGQVAYRAVPVPGPMADPGTRAAMADPGTRAAMADQATRAAMADPVQLTFVSAGPVQFSASRAPPRVGAHRAQSRARSGSGVHKIHSRARSGPRAHGVHSGTTPRDW